MKLKTLFQTKAFHKVIIVIGGALALGSILLGWGGFDLMINFGIRMMMRLVPDSQTWKTWKTIPIPVYMKFHLFNITNPDELGDGAKPVVKELGPYVYLVDFDKFDFETNAKHDTVKYKPTKTYYFQPKMSKGKEDDLLTYINFVFVGVSHVAHDFTEIEFLLESLDNMLAEKGEKLTRTDKVKDLLFDGISIQALIELANDPLVQQSGYFELPKDFEDGFVALFKGKNGTKDGRWECHSGIRKSSEVGKLYSYNGKKKLDIYKGDSCNAINGTDGTLNPPFIEPGITDLYVFIPELCRSVKWEYVTLAELSGIPVARYKFPDIQTTDENPDVWCFCPKENSSHCDQHGIANLAKCFGGAPMLYSKPHFLKVDSSVLEMIQGVHPNAKLHESRLDIHPLSGVAIFASVKMQFSIELVPWPEMPSFRNASRAFVPLAWVELVANLDGINLKLIQLLAIFLKLYPILRWFSLFGSLGIVIFGATMIHRSRQQLAAEALNDVDEEDIMPDINKEVGVWIKKVDQDESHAKGD